MVIYCPLSVGFDCQDEPFDHKGRNGPQYHSKANRRIKTCLIGIDCLVPAKIIVDRENFAMRAFLLDPSKHKYLYKDEEEVYYADLYPQRPGQPEDDLNEKTAREGYTFTSQIKVSLYLLTKNETPAAFDVIQETLGASLSKLAYMGKSVISEQLSVTIPKYQIANCSNSSYQIPEKLFMKEPNRENWAVELASTETSLFDVAQQKVPIYRFF